jgi:hypothetical protein
MSVSTRRSVELFVFSGEGVIPIETMTAGQMMEFAISAMSFGWRLSLFP